jgi:hypothetical protein
VHLVAGQEGVASRKCTTSYYGIGEAISDAGTDSLSLVSFWLCVTSFYSKI